MKKIHSITIEAIPDYDSDLSYLGTFGKEAGEFAIKHEGDRNSYPYFNADNVENMKQARQNYNRVMQYDRGEVSDYGIKAMATIHTSDDGKSWLINKINSGGVWGYSSDSEAAEFDAEAENQLEELKNTLLEFGFIEKEFNNITPAREGWPV